MNLVKRVLLVVTFFTVSKNYSSEMPAFLIINLGCNAYQNAKECIRNCFGKKKDQFKRGIQEQSTQGALASGLSTLTHLYALSLFTERPKTTVGITVLTGIAIMSLWSAKEAHLDMQRRKTDLHMIDKLNNFSPEELQFNRNLFLGIGAISSFAAYKLYSRS